MPLNDAQRQAIREEEYFRAEIRRDIAAAIPPTSLTGLAAFFDTKAGFWLLTTVLAGLVATGMTWLQRYMDREEIRKRETAERALRDTETLLKLGPMLTSEKRSQVDIGDRTPRRSVERCSRRHEGVGSDKSSHSGNA